MILPKKEEEWESMVGMLPEEGTLDGKPPIKVPNKHIIPADNILVNKELGTGEFGVVQQGVWTNDGERIQVAIKCLSRERMQNNPIEFLKEAAIMHGIDDEHIVRLYGVVLDTNALMLVTELAPLRSLLECLKEPSLRASFPVISLCNFAVQICSGMQYLEMKRLIHRDLAARNILVFSKNKVNSRFYCQVKQTICSFQLKPAHRIPLFLSVILHLCNKNVVLTPILPDFFSKYRTGPGFLKLLMRKTKESCLKNCQL